MRDEYYARIFRTHDYSFSFKTSRAIASLCWALEILYRAFDLLHQSFDILSILAISVDNYVYVEENNYILIWNIKYNMFFIYYKLLAVSIYFSNLNYQHIRITHYFANTFPQENIYGNSSLQNLANNSERELQNYR